MFHRVDDAMALPSSRYFRMAQRLEIRGGAVTHARGRRRSAVRPLPGAGEHLAQAVAEVSPATLAALSDNPGFPGIEYDGG